MTKRPNQGKKKHGNYQGDKTKTGIAELKGKYFKVADPDAYNNTIKAIIEYVQTVEELIIMLLCTQAQ